MTEDDNTWEQKKRFHAMVRDIANQVQWCGEWWDEEEWKRLVIGAACGQRVVPNPFGTGFIVMNTKRVRSMGLPTMSELIEQLFAFGAEKDVKWTDGQT